MSNGYKPRQRTVPSSVLTTAGWLTCEFNVLEKGHLREQLDGVDEFYKVTNASLVGIETTVDFLALQRDTIELVVPRNEPDELLAAPLADSQSEEVYVLFPGGVIRGTLEWRSNVRLSDFVTRQRGFILLRGCHIELGHVLAEEKRVHDADAVLVNVNQIVGISEKYPG